MNFEKLAKQVIKESIGDIRGTTGEKWYGSYQYDDYEITIPLGGGNSVSYQIDAIVEYNVLDDSDHDREYGYGNYEIVTIDDVNIINVRKISEEDIIDIPINDSDFATLKKYIKDRIADVASDDPELKSRLNEIED